MVFDIRNSITEEEADAQDLGRISVIADRTQPKESPNENLPQISENQVSPSQQETGRFNLDNSIPEEQVEIEESKDLRETEKGVRSLTKPIGPKTEAVSDAVANFIVSPLFEIGRGFGEGAESLYGKLDAVTELMERGMGIPRSGEFGNWANTMGNFTQSIPETRLGNIDKGALNLLGSAIPVAVEFGLVKFPKGAGKAVQSLSEVGKFAVLGALEEFKEDEDKKLSSLVKGAAKGAAVSMTFQSAGVLLKLLKEQGVNAFKVAVAKITGSVKAAERLAKNPQSLNLNPFSNKPKTATEIRAENKIAREKIKQQAKEEIAALRKSGADKMDVLKSDLQDKSNALDVVHRDMKEGLRTKGGFRIADATRKASEAINQFNQKINNTAVAFYDTSLQKFSALKRNAGKAVETAVKSATNRNPGASVPYKTVSNNVIATLRDKSPFPVDRKGRVRAVAGQIENKEEIKALQDFIDDFRSRKAQGGLGIEYLQRVKNIFNDKATALFKKQGGDKQLAAMYQQLSNDVNPAKIVAKDKNLQRSLFEIHEANQLFSKTAENYELAMQNYYKKVNGQYVPAPEKALNALATNNRKAILEMQKADALLDPSDKMLPRMRTLSAAMESNRNKQRAIESSIKAQNRRNMIQLEKANRAAKKRFNKNKQKMTKAQREATANEIETTIKVQRDEFSEIDRILTEREAFHADQDILRGSRGQGFAGIAQTLFTFGTIVPEAQRLVGGGGTGGVSIPALGGVIALSPIGAANIAKTGISGLNLTDKTIGAAIRDENVQRVVGMALIRRILDRKKEQPTLEE